MRLIKRSGWYLVAVVCGALVSFGASMGMAQVSQAVETQPRYRFDRIVDTTDDGVEVARCYFWMVEYWENGRKIGEQPMGEPRCVVTRL